MSFSHPPGHGELTDIVVGVTFWMMPEQRVRPPLRWYVQEECVELFKNRDRVSATSHPLDCLRYYAKGLVTYENPFSLFQSVPALASASRPTGMSFD